MPYESFKDQSELLIGIKLTRDEWNKVLRCMYGQDHNVSLATKVALKIPIFQGAPHSAHAEYCYCDICRSARIKAGKEIVIKKQQSLTKIKTQI